MYLCGGYFEKLTGHNNKPSHIDNLLKVIFCATILFCTYLYLACESLQTEQGNTYCPFVY